MSFLAALLDGMIGPALAIALLRWLDWRWPRPRRMTDDERLRLACVTTLFVVAVVSARGMLA